MTSEGCVTWQQANTVVEILLYCREQEVSRQKQRLFAHVIAITNKSVRFKCISGDNKQNFINRHVNPKQNQ